MENKEELKQAIDHLQKAAELLQNLEPETFDKIMTVGNFNPEGEAEHLKTLARMLAKVIGE